jgi:hypothetical protein
MTKAVVSAAVASFGGILVFVGLWMEKGAEKGWFLNVNDLRRRRLKAKWGWRVLMLGIFVEIGTGAALTWHDVAENMQTAKQIAKNDPLNQPIASLTASVSLMNLGTNRTKIDPGKPFGGAAFVKLRFGCSKHPENGWPVQLTCVSCETSPVIGTPTNKIPNFSDKPMGNAWLLEFGSSGMGHVLNVIPPKANVRDAVDWDAVEFDAPFLPPGTEIIRGDIILTINSTTKRFEIPPQKIQKAEEIPLTAEEKAKGVIFSFRSPAIAKSVTVISW